MFVYVLKDKYKCILEIVDDPESMRGISDFWREYLAQRMSLGCYEEKDGKSKLVALNVCVVITKGEKHDDVVSP